MDRSAFWQKLLGGTSAGLSIIVTCALMVIAISMTEDWGFIQVVLAFTVICMSLTLAASNLVLRRNQRIAKRIDLTKLEYANYSQITYNDMREKLATSDWQLQARMIDMGMTKRNIRLSRGLKQSNPLEFVAAK